MMGGPMMGGTMRVLTDRSSVPAGPVSFRVANTGSLVHEFVVLPLPAGQSSRTGRSAPTAGSTRPAGRRGVAELRRRRRGRHQPRFAQLGPVEPQDRNYELICNLAGHYAAGMYSKLTVA